MSSSYKEDYLLKRHSKVCGDKIPDKHVWFVLTSSRISILEDPKLL